MFNNEIDLEGVKRLLEAIEDFGFDKDNNLEEKIKFRCYFGAGVYLNERLRNIFWDKLHEILENDDIKEKIKDYMFTGFTAEIRDSIKKARFNLDVAEIAIEKKGK